MFKTPFSSHGTYIEQKYVVLKYRRFYPDRGAQRSGSGAPYGKGLLQFYSRERGLHTIDVCDIIDIT
jgi:hypothetical protein